MFVMIPPFLLFISCQEQHSDTATQVIIEEVIEDTSVQEDSSVPQDTSQDTDVPQGPPFEIQSLSPSFGPTTGGTELLLLGKDFPEDARVYIGGEEASLLSHTAEQIQLLSPSIDQEGSAAVQVQSTEGVVSMNNAFTYHKAEPNLTGFLAKLSHQATIGNYWTQETQAASAKALFLRPIDLHWWQLITEEMDTCSLHDREDDFDIYPLDMETPFLEFHHDLLDVSLSFDAYYNIYTSDSLEFSLLPTNTFLSLSPLQGTLEGLRLMDAIQTSAPLALFEPILDGLVPTSLQSDQIFSWEPSGASWIEFRMVLLDPTDTSLVQELHCIAQDDGFFQMDRTLWTSWTSDLLVHVYVTRVIETNTTMPHNLSIARMAGYYTTIGAGYAQ